MWIARDKDGRLFLHVCKPKLEQETWWANSNPDSIPYLMDMDGEHHYCVELDRKQFPEVTFKNSPKELVVK